MSLMSRRVAILLAAAALASCRNAAIETTVGTAGVVSGQQTVTLDGTPVEVFTYRPAGCSVTGILLVFHGLERNVASYRDDATPLAQRYCLVVVAPLFDAVRFPGRAYQRGGIVQHGAVQPANTWTVRYAPLLAEWARRAEGRPNLPYSQIGHSAGAQYLSRVVAYSSGPAQRSVVANPSTWVRPSLDVAAPYGFGGLPDAEAALRRYLAAPMTVLLGREDRGTKNLATSDEAEDQGANRFERGQAVFAEGEAAARQHGWTFGWTLAVVPGVGHNARQMLTSDAALAALHP